MFLSDTIGHASIRQALINAFAQQRVHHAYLVAGPDGIGKRRIAMGFAALINCIGDPHVDSESRRVGGCGDCRSCRLIEKSLNDGVTAHPDIPYIVPDGTQIKIEQIREILRQVPFPPIEAAFRVIIIDPAEAMGDAAANAILKTLEEPSSRTRFILLSSRPNALLTTIRSRCQILSCQPLSHDDIRTFLSQRAPELTGEDLARTTRWAEGRPARALALLEDTAAAEIEALMMDLLAIEAGDSVAAFSFANTLYEHRKQLTLIVESLQRIYRDLLLIRTGSAPQVPVVNTHLIPQLTRIAEQLGTEAILRRLDLITETAYGIEKRHINPRMSFERLVLGLTAPAGAEAFQLGLAGQLYR